MIHALPGMGADHRMFPDPWGTLPGFIAHDWPPCNDESKLAEVASRLCREHRIQDVDVLVGASLGGMIACEIAKLRKRESSFLIDSATSKAEISRFLTFAHPVARFTPFECLQFSAGKISQSTGAWFW